MRIASDVCSEGVPSSKSAMAFSTRISPMTWLTVPRAVARTNSPRRKAADDTATSDCSLPSAGTSTSAVRKATTTSASAIAQENRFGAMTSLRSGAFWRRSVTKSHAGITIARTTTRSRSVTAVLTEIETSRWR